MHRSYYLPCQVFFGSISPIATRLMLKSLNETGKVTGKIGAISTIGSLIGTFVGGFILIPYLGVQQVMLSVGVLMLLLSAIFSVQHFLKFAGLGIIIVALHCFFPQAVYGKRYSTLYNDVMIYETMSMLVAIAYVSCKSTITLDPHSICIAMN